MKKLNAYEQSEEISALAQDFVKAIFDGRVTDPNGPYALTSRLRPDHHIGTSSAPQTLHGRMESLKNILQQEEDTAQAYGIVRNLEQTVQSMAYAERIVAGKDTKLTPDNQGHIQNSLRENLPGMRETLESLRTILKPQGGQQPF